MSAKRVTALSLLLALALILSYVEFLLPIPMPIPGMKLGLSNLVSVFCIYRLSVKEAYWLLVLRIAISSVLFGTAISFLYGITGGLLSLTAMTVLKKIGKFSPVSVSVIGGVIHNVAQVLLAVWLIGISAVFSYLPILMVAGFLSGLVIGIIGNLLIRTIPGSVL